ncbi:MAG: hydrogenase maturation nickel metallochaperone HypA [Vulcanimicrobiota bacterium]
MHELSIAHSIVEMVSEVADREGATRILAIHLRIGALSAVVEEALRFAFEIAAVGTPAAEARLEIEAVPVTIFCQACQAEHQLASVQRFFCPVCQQPSAKIVAGNELEVVRLEVEDACELSS